MKWTQEQFSEAALMREQGIPWKHIERAIGDGVKGAYHNQIFRQRHPEKIRERYETRVIKHGIPKLNGEKTFIKMAHPLRSYKSRYDGVMAVTERRAHIMCNAWFGLDLYAGLAPTATERKLTAQTIRFLRSRGLLLDCAVTDGGKLFLRQIRLSDGKREKTC